MDSSLRTPYTQASMPTVSSTHLKPPTAHPHPRRSHSPQSASSAPSAPRPPLAIHPTATVAESAVMQGTYQISIGAGTVIHPRARMYSFEGPIIIGDGCTIAEKSIIGTPPPETMNLSSPRSTTLTPTTTFTFAPSSTDQSTTPKTIRISTAVSVGPLSSILPGVQIHSASIVDTLVTINRNADVGAHSKVCSGCEIPENGVVSEWTVVWGAGAGFGQRRRKRAKGAMDVSPHVVGGVQRDQIKSPEGRVIEDARLIVLSREREALARMVGVAPAGSGRRR